MVRVSDIEPLSIYCSTLLNAPEEIYAVRLYAIRNIYCVLVELPSHNTHIDQHHAYLSILFNHRTSPLVR